MARRCVAGMVLAVALVQGTVEGRAQALPNFAGQWSFDWTGHPPSPTAGPGRGAPAGGNFGEVFTATQDARTLVVNYTARDRPVRQEFALDGRETLNRVPTRGGQWEERSSARWDGARLIIVTKLPNNVLTRTLSLVKGVLVMNIELTVQNEPPMVSTIRYTKGGAK